MAEINTDSYKLPAQPSALERMGQIVDLKNKVNSEQRNAVALDRDKLELAYRGMDYLTGEINSLPPEATPDQVFRVMQNAVNMKFLTPEAYSQAIKEVPTRKEDMQAYKDRFIARAQNARQALEYYAGQRIEPQDTGQTVQERVYSPRPGFGGPRAIGLPVQKQIPPTAETVNPDTGQPQFLGPQSPQLAPGTSSGAPPLPMARPAGAPMAVGPDTAAPPKGLPIPVDGVPTPAQSIANRFPNIPRGPATGLPPGVSEAAVVTGTQSGQQLAADRTKASSFQREIFPLAQAIPTLESLGTKGTGPGTETINNLKSFVLSNVPGVKETDFNGTVKDFDIAKKYLTDFVNQTGSSGTNDKLAAAFAGNPSVGISNAAAVDVAKSALALRRMQHGLLQEFEQTGQRDDQYSKWVARRINEYDPRAFGVDMMSPEAKIKLRKQLDRNPVERRRFEKSLELAEGLNFFTPVK